MALRPQTLECRKCGYKQLSTRIGTTVRALDLTSIERCSDPDAKTQHNALLCPHFRESTETPAP
jgi:hypothetical protein